MESNPEDIFNRFVATLGDAYTTAEVIGSSQAPPLPGSMLDHVKEVLDSLVRSTASSERPFKYCAGLIYALKPTGYCALHEGHYCIGVTTAVYNCALEMSLRLFQSDRTFATIGRLTPPKPQTDARGPPLPWGFAWREALNEYERTHKVSPSLDAEPVLIDPFAIPSFAEAMTLECPVRSACAEYVAQMMTKFVWSHELAHAISGHLPYLGQRKNVKTLSENDWYEDSQEEKYLYSAIRLWIEHDADTSAINTLLLSNLQGIVLHHTGVAEVDDDRALRIRLDIMAFLLTFLLLHFQYDWQRAAEGKHPDPLRRAYVGVMAAITLLLAEVAEPARLVAEIKGDIQALIQSSTLHMPLLVFFAPIASDLTFTEYNDLVKQVSDVVPKIREYSFFDDQGRLAVPDD